MDSSSQTDHLHAEGHTDGTSGRLNWLRAAVLGANDGIVSVAALVVGVASASTSSHLLFTVGIAALVAGALSMAVGEYVSVSSQRDSEKALLAKERYELANYPEAELEELVQLYEAKGLSRTTAETVATELTNHDAFAAHVDAELRIDPHDLTNPLHAAVASAIAFSLGAIIPVLAIVVPPVAVRIPVTFGAVLLALIVTGVVSATVGGAGKTRATARVVIGGILAMAVTFAVGTLFGTQGV